MTTNKGTDAYIDTATRHYLAALLWTTPCNGTAAAYHDACPGESCDVSLDFMNFDPDDVSVVGVAAARGDVADFVRANWADLRPMGDARFWAPEQCGHDFLLTRGGHGAGFWDRGEGDRGDRLAAAARVYGDVYAYVNGDGKVDIQ